jgi:hypothetical protein
MLVRKKTPQYIWYVWCTCFYTFNIGSIYFPLMVDFLPPLREPRGIEMGPRLLRLEGASVIILPVQQVSYGPLIMSIILIMSCYTGFFNVRREWQSLNTGPRFYLRLIRRTGWEFWLSLCKIVRSSVILLLPLLTIIFWFRVDDCFPIKSCEPYLLSNI